MESVNREINVRDKSKEIGWLVNSRGSIKDEIWRGIFYSRDDDLQVVDTWVPVTPQKLTPVKPHPVPVNRYGNLHQGGNWQQQLTGITREHVPVGASYNGMTQAVSPNGQLQRYGYDGSLGENIQIINHISDSYNAGSFTQLLCDEGSGWKDNPLTQQLLHDNASYVASANRNPSRSVDIAANTPLIPKLHPQLRNQGIDSDSFLLTNQNFNSGAYPSSSVDIAVNTHLYPKLHPQLRNQGIDSASFLLTNQNCNNGLYPSSKVMSTSLVMDFPSQVDNNQRDSNSVHWLFGDQNYCSSSNSNPLSYGDSSSQICQNDFPVPFMSSCDLNSLPTIEADAASCVASQHQFTTDQDKNLENDQLSALLKFLIEEGSSKEKDEEVKLTMSIGDETKRSYPVHKAPALRRVWER